MRSSIRPASTAMPFFIRTCRILIMNTIAEALMLAMDKNDIPQGTQKRLLEMYARCIVTS